MRPADAVNTPSSSGKEANLADLGPTGSAVALRDHMGRREFPTREVEPNRASSIRADRPMEEDRPSYFASYIPCVPSLY